MNSDGISRKRRLAGLSFLGDEKCKCAKLLQERLSRPGTRLARIGGAKTMGNDEPHPSEFASRTEPQLPLGLELVDPCYRGGILG